MTEAETQMFCRTASIHPDAEPMFRSRRSRSNASAASVATVSVTPTATRAPPPSLNVTPLMHMKRVETGSSGYGSPREADCWLFEPDEFNDLRGSATKPHLGRNSTSIIRDSPTAVPPPQPEAESPAPAAQGLAAAVAQRMASKRAKSYRAASKSTADQEDMPSPNPVAVKGARAAVAPRAGPSGKQPLGNSNNAINAQQRKQPKTSGDQQQPEPSNPQRSTLRVTSTTSTPPPIREVVTPRDAGVPMDSTPRAGGVAVPLFGGAQATVAAAEEESSLREWSTEAAVGSRTPATPSQSTAAQDVDSSPEFVEEVSPAKTQQKQPQPTNRVANVKAPESVTPKPKVSKPEAEKKAERKPAPAVPTSPATPTPTTSSSDAADAGTKQYGSTSLRAALQERKERKAAAKAATPVKQRVVTKDAQCSPLVDGRTFDEVMLKAVEQQQQPGNKKTADGSACCTVM